MQERLRDGLLCREVNGWDVSDDFHNDSNDDEPSCRLYLAFETRVGSAGLWCYGTHSDLYTCCALGIEFFEGVVCGGCFEDFIILYPSFNN